MTIKESLDVIVKADEYLKAGNKAEANRLVLELPVRANELRDSRQ
jgi:hypothetical protein